MYRLTVWYMAVYFVIMQFIWRYVRPTVDTNSLNFSVNRISLFCDTYLII